MAITTTPSVPETKTRIVNINGRPLNFLEAPTPRGERKGQPQLAPQWKKQTAPELTEIVDVISALGQGPLCKQIGKLLRSLAANAAADAVVKNADGTFSIDTGKFSSALLAEVADMDSGTKDQIEADLESANVEFNKVFTEAFTNYISKNIVIPDALKNKVAQLMVKREQLTEKLAKGKRGGKKDDTAAKSVTTAAAAPSGPVLA